MIERPADRPRRLAPRHARRSPRRPTWRSAAATAARPDHQRPQRGRPARRGSTCAPAAGALLAPLPAAFVDRAGAGAGRRDVLLAHEAGYGLGTASADRLLRRPPRRLRHDLLSCVGFATNGGRHRGQLAEPSSAGHADRPARGAANSRRRAATRPTPALPALGRRAAAPVGEVVRRPSPSNRERVRAARRSPAASPPLAGRCRPVRQAVALRRRSTERRRRLLDAAAGRRQVTVDPRYGRWRPSPVGLPPRSPPGRRRARPRGQPARPALPGEPRRPRGSGRPAERGRRRRTAAVARRPAAGRPWSGSARPGPRADAPAAPARLSSGRRPRPSCAPAATRRRPPSPASPSFDHHYERGRHLRRGLPRASSRSWWRRPAEAAGRRPASSTPCPGSPLVAERTVELLRADPRVDVDGLPGALVPRPGLGPPRRRPAGRRRPPGRRDPLRRRGGRRAGPAARRPVLVDAVLSEIKLSLDTDRVGELPRGHAAAPPRPARRAGGRRCAGPTSTGPLEPDHLTSVWIPALAAPVAGELVGPRRAGPHPAAAVPVGPRADPRLADPPPARGDLRGARRHRRADPGRRGRRRGGGRRPSDAVEHLEEELGDLLFQVVFHSRLAAEEGRFTLADVARGVHDKLVARHPHVFGDVMADDRRRGGRPTGRRSRQAEKGRESVTDGIPAALPALALAAKLPRKAGRCRDGARPASTEDRGAAGRAGAAPAAGGRRSRRHRRRGGRPTADRAPDRRAAVEPGRPGPRGWASIPRTPCGRGVAVPPAASREVERAA